MVKARMRSSENFKEENSHTESQVPHFHERGTALQQILDCSQQTL